MKLVDRTCLHCGSPINPKNRNYRRMKYCGQSCYFASQRGRKRAPMSEEAKIHISEAKIGKPRPEIRGENHPRWKGGIAPERQCAMARVEYRNWRTKVYERDDYTCVWCGLHGGRLNVHHVVPYSDSEKLRYDEDNGVTMCVDCHKGLHTWFKPRVY